MRVRFWREGEASELIFGGDLTEQVSKAESRKKSSSSKSKGPCKAGTHSFYGFSDSNKPRWNPSSHEHQSFWMAPFLENRNGQAINQNNPAATTLKRRLQCKWSSTQSSSKISSQDIFCLFSSFSSTIVLFTPGNVTNLSDCLLVEEIRNLIDKGAILESF